jgi:hypothetical protein
MVYANSALGRSAWQAQCISCRDGIWSRRGEAKHHFDTKYKGLADKKGRPNPPEMHLLPLRKGFSNFEQILASRVGFQYRVPGSGKKRKFPVSFPALIPGLRSGFPVSKVYVLIDTLPGYELN